MCKSASIRLTAAIVFAVMSLPALSVVAQEANEVATATSIYTVEATYTAGGNDWLRAKVVIEFAHVSGANFYSAQGWGPQVGERRWSLSPVFTSVPAEPFFPKAIVAQPGNLLYILASGVARANDEDKINEMYARLESDFRINGYPWQVYGKIPDDFRAWVSFDRDTVSVGESFEARLVFDNYVTFGEDLTNVTPTAPLSMTSQDGAELTVDSGPFPASVASLQYAETDTIRYEVTAVAPGTVRVEGMLEADFNLFFPDVVASTSVCGQFESTPCTVVIEESGLVVNDTGDGEDLDPGDGICDADDDADGPQCTLRAVLQEAEALGGEAEITFDLEGEPPYLIAPESALPTIGSAITLDATTQPGWVDVPLVRIDGSGAGGGAAGLTVNGDDVTIRGFMITGFESHGIHVAGGTGGMLETLIVGSDASGAGGLGNGGDGIHISGGTDLTIGSEAGAGKTGPAGSQAINIGSVVSMGNLLNGLYAANASNAALIRSDVRAVQVREGAAAKGGGSAAQALSINLNVNNLVVGTLGVLNNAVSRPNGQNGVCLRGISDAVFKRLHISDAAANAFEITASQRITILRMIAGMRAPMPQTQDHIGSIGGSILKIFESLDITVGSSSASDEPVQGIAASGWFMDVQDSERIDVANVMAGLTANMESIPASMRALMRNLAGGMFFHNTPFATVGRMGVPTILANNGGNSSMPQAGLMVTGELTEAFRALNLHLGTTPSGLAGIGNLGSGLVLADGIRDALLGGENPFERIVSAGNAGYGYLFRDIAPTGPNKGGGIINIVSGTRLISDMVPIQNGALAAISNSLSGFCMLRAQGVMMDRFSVGPSGRHGIETIDSSDLQFLSGAIGSLFGEPVTTPAQLMGPAQNGFSFEGGRRISVGGPFGLGGTLSELLNVFINDAGGRGVSAEAVERLEMVSTGVGTPPPGSEVSAAVLERMGAQLEAIRIRNSVNALLRGVHLLGNGKGSQDGMGGLFVELSRNIQLIQSQLGGILENGQPTRPNAGTAIRSFLNDSLVVKLTRLVGHAKGIEAENSTVRLENNRIDMQGVLGGVGRAIEQLGGTLEALNNSLSQNRGPAFALSEMQSALIRFNNITGNFIGVLAEEAGEGNDPALPGKSGTPGTILAPDNWWGDASGPGGEGPGTGDSISEGVTVDSWLTSANGIVISPETRFAESESGSSIVIPVTFATPLIESDVIDVMVSDERGWIASATSFQVGVEGPAGATRDLEVTVGAEGVDRITIHASSTTDATLQGEAVVVIAPPGSARPLESAAVSGADRLDTFAEGLLSIGGEIIVNPGGANEETAVVAGFGSIILASPLRFDHAAGEMVIPANSMSVDREMDADSAVPAEWGVQVWPNPVRRQLRVRIETPVPESRNVELFDLLGRRVAVMSDADRPAGRHELSIIVSDLTPGVYIVRIESEVQIRTIPVTVVR